jgi:hypothetical protein
MCLQLAHKCFSYATVEDCHEPGNLPPRSGLPEDCCLLTNLVAKALRRNDSDLITKALVGLEVQRQLRVVALDDDLGGLLDGLELLKRISVWFSFLSATN